MAVVETESYHLGITQFDSLEWFYFTFYQICVEKQWRLNICDPS